MEGPGKGSHRARFTLRFSLPYCVWLKDMCRLVLFWLRIVVNCFNSGRTFWQYVSTVKGIDEVLAQMVLILLLTSVEHWSSILPNKAFLDAHMAPQEFLPLEKDPDSVLHLRHCNVQHTLVSYNYHESDAVCIVLIICSKVWARERPPLHEIGTYLLNKSSIKERVNVSPGFFFPLSFTLLSQDTFWLQPLPYLHLVSTPTHLLSPRSTAPLFLFRKEQACQWFQLNTV